MYFVCKGLVFLEMVQFCAVTALTGKMPVLLFVCLFIQSCFAYFLISVCNLQNNNKNPLCAFPPPSQTLHTFSMNKH